MENKEIVLSELCLIRDMIEDDLRDSMNMGERSIYKDLKKEVEVMEECIRLCKIYYGE